MGKIIKLKNDVYIANEYYSTNETIIGTWKDGKPLYKKTIYSTTTSGNLGITNVDFLRFINFNVYIDNKFLFPDARYTSANDSLDFFVNKASGTYTLTLGSSWSSKFNWLVFDLEYTKTID